VPRLRLHLLIPCLFIPALAQPGDYSYAQLWGAWSHTAPNTFNQALLTDQSFSGAYGVGLDLNWEFSEPVGLAFRGEIWQWANATTFANTQVDYGLRLNPLLLGINLREPGLINQLSFELGLYAGVGLLEFDANLRGNAPQSQSWRTDIFMGEVSVKAVYELFPHYQTFLMGSYRFASNAYLALDSGGADPPLDISGPTVAYGIGYLF
jgi:hypothetical protein